MNETTPNRDAAAAEAVKRAGVAARRASLALANADEEQINRALVRISELLQAEAEPVLAANAADVEAARADGMGAGLLDRLVLNEARLRGMSEQLIVLAETPFLPRVRLYRELGDDRVVLERRRPVGVIGANFEARPNVTVDMASQALKSGNAVVLRTGSAALGTAAALVDRVIGPALEESGLPADGVQLLRFPGRESAAALVRQPDLIPLVILRGSGDSTRRLSRVAAVEGVSVLAHADGGGVLYVHEAADAGTVRELVAAGLDRLGVCNRLNLLLVDSSVYDDVVPRVRAQLAAMEPAISLSEPPHDHPLGYEWSLDDARSATVTVAPVDGLLEAAGIANEETSGLGATIATEDVDAANDFLNAYSGTGAFVNETTRLLDGYKLLGLPETGINVGRALGPRGPVTFRDLSIQQWVTGSSRFLKPLIGR